MQRAVLQHLGHQVIKVDDLKAQVAEMVHIVVFKGVVALGTVEYNPFGPGLTDHLQVVAGQFLEDLHLTIPQHVVAAAVLIVTDHRFNPSQVENPDNVLAHREAVHSDVAEDHLKIGHAAHKEEGVAALRHLSCLPGPLGFLLIDPLGLEFHDGLEHAMVGIDRCGSQFGGFFSKESHELREVDAGGAALKAAAAGQARPEIAVFQQFVAQAKKGFFHNESRRKAGQHPGHRATPGTNPAVQTIIGFSQLGGIFNVHAASPRGFLPRSLIFWVKEVTIPAKRAASADETHSRASLPLSIPIKSSSSRVISMIRLAFSLPSR